LNLNLVMKKVTVPYSYQDINDVDTSKLLIEQEEIINHLQEERIGHLAKITELNKEVMLLNSQLDNVLKQVRMMTTRTDVLDRMLEGKVKGKPNGIGFTHGAKGKIVGIGNLVSEGSPRLDNVLLVKGLSANLISISQLCDQGLSVNFSKTECQIIDGEGTMSMRGTRSKDKCYLWVSQEEALISTCMLSKDEEVRVWHQKLGHLNMQGIKKVISLEAIKGIPKLEITEGSICRECQVGKQTRISHPRLEHQRTSKVFELPHIDLMGPMQVTNIGGKRYFLVVVDDFSRFTWVNFIREKSDTFESFKELCIQLQREKDRGIVRIRSDHGTQFENSKFHEYCIGEGIKHEFSSPITPQQNGVVERKNRTLQVELSKRAGPKARIKRRAWA